jgi:hypothetical protein
LYLGPVEVDVLAKIETPQEMQKLQDAGLIS